MLSIIFPHRLHSHSLELAGFVRLFLSFIRNGGVPAGYFVRWVGLPPLPARVGGRASALSTRNPSRCNFSITACRIKADRSGNFPLRSRSTSLRRAASIHSEIAF